SLRIASPGRFRSLWRRAVEVARRMCGADVAVWRVAETIAAEALAGRGRARDGGNFDDELARLLALHQRRSPATPSADPSAGRSFGSKRMALSNGVAVNEPTDTGPVEI